MNHDCVAVLLETQDELADALHRLAEVEVGPEHISIVSRSSDRDASPRVERKVPDAADLQSGDEAEEKTVRGATAGGVFGALAGASLMFIPGVGPLLASGAFAGALTGGIVGGYLGSMQGWGVHDDHIRKYDAAVKDGKILMVIHGSPLHLARAVRVLRERFTEVHMHTVTSADAPELIEETSTKRL